MSDAFHHHAWASGRLLDVCMELNGEQLHTAVPGTFGSIIETLRHMVESDGWYLSVATGERAHWVATKTMNVSELRATAASRDGGWASFLALGPDPDADLHEVDEEDGFQRHTPVGIQLAQALHHGTDHRSQVCTALTALGLEPPKIDVWAFGADTGRVVEIEPPA